jgi:hypothetical protein
MRNTIAIKDILVVVFSIIISAQCQLVLGDVEVLTLHLDDAMSRLVELNYTRVVAKKGLVCNIEGFDSSAQNIFFEENELLPKKAYNCTKVVAELLEVNCNKFANRIYGCVGRNFDPDLIKVPFDGTSNCDDMENALLVKTGTEGSEELEKCQLDTVSAQANGDINTQRKEVLSGHRALVTIAAVENEWSREQKKVNYTKIITQAGVACKMKGTNISEVDVFFGEHEVLPARAGKCVLATAAITEINCDVTAKRIYNCKGSHYDPSLKNMKFDGMQNCADVINAMLMKYNKHEVAEFEECQGEERRLQSAEYPLSCTEARFCTYSYFFEGYSIPLQAHNHAHNIQDNVRGWSGGDVGVSSYDTMPGWARYKRVGFTMQSDIDLYEGSYLYRCTGAPATYVHAKGKMRGVYAASNNVRLYRPTNTCGKYSDGTLRGVQSSTDCLMDIEYSVSNCQVVGARTTQLTTAWLG